MSDERMLHVLEAIRDEVQATNARLESLEGHVQGTNVRLGSVEGRLHRIEQHSAELGDRFDRMTRRQTNSELALATEVLALADVTRQVRDLLATASTTITPWWTTSAASWTSKGD
jgi:hypothetical protein